ncbi:ABC transporter permease [Oscillospiraceae bacterium Marseille-Q3528]|nr:ABC transporter permease [Oscillospiraceae bacterium Marseille-Q3528]
MSEEKKKKPLKERIGENIVQFFSFSAIIVLVVFLSISQKTFLSPMNLSNLFRDTSTLIVLASGMFMVLLFGSIDLSMGAACSVSNVLYVKFLLTYGPKFIPAAAGVIGLLISLVFGMVAGGLLGFIHVKLKVPSFIASLGFMSVWQSTALLITENPESIPKAMWGAVNWYKISFGVFGLPIILALLIVAVIFFFTNYTTVGRAIFAIGGNERTARVAGLHVDKIKIIVFIINGMLAALAGVFLAGSVRSSSPTIGDAYTLKIVASCALGGVSLAGGKGSVLGALLGVFTITLIQNGMTFLGVDAYSQNIVLGVFVLAAIAMTADRRRKDLIIK